LSRRKRGNPVHGVVLLDKPAGLTSNQALQKVKRLFDARKAGHTGNLDPFATGMLPVCLGEATKTAAFMLDANKAYRAVARLGEATATGDIEGEVVHSLPVPALGDEKIRVALAAFTGAIEQVPPMYSALKHQGRPLYEWAREGVEVEREARTVTIHSLALVAWEPPRLEFEVHCSKGTYIRTLAEDISQELGTCAHLVGLRRLSVGLFPAEHMVSLEQLERDRQIGELKQHLLPADAGLAAWPVVKVSSSQVIGFTRGNPQQLDEFQPGWARIYGPQDQLLGLGECTASGLLKPRRVFNRETEQVG